MTLAMSLTSDVWIAVGAVAAATLTYLIARHTRP